MEKQKKTACFKPFSATFLLGVMILFIFFSVQNTLAADLGTFEKQGCVSLHQVCANCTYVNLTSVKYPNGTIQKYGLYMTSTGNDYTYSFCQTTLVGDYSYNTCGNPDAQKVCENINFHITGTGTDLNIGQAVGYIIVGALLVGVFLLSLYGAIKIQWNNQRGEDGEVVGINNMKYLKVFCIIMCYVFLMFIFGFGRSVAANLLLYNNASNFFDYGFFLMLSGIWPAIVISLFAVVVSLVNDSKLHKSILRGVPMR